METTNKICSECKQPTDNLKPTHGYGDIQDNILWEGLCPECEKIDQGLVTFGIWEGHAFDEVSTDYLTWLVNQDGFSDLIKQQANLALEKRNDYVENQ